MSDWQVLSLTQPWAHALFVPGLKRIETRSWSTKYRGRLYIHAAKGFPRPAREFYNEEVEAGRIPYRLEWGAIIGHVNLLDIKPVEYVRKNISAIEESYGDYADGRFAWLLDNATLLLEPIKANGHLGIWKYAA